MLPTKPNSYTFQMDGICYFSRRVPADLRRHFITGGIAYSLRTKSIRDARVGAISDAADLDRHWHFLRIFSDELPGKHLLADAFPEPVAQATIVDHTFKAAVAVCLRLKGNHRPATFDAAARRSCQLWCKKLPVVQSKSRPFGPALWSVAPSNSRPVLRRIGREANPMRRQFLVCFDLL
jgi:hypothetical protein